jgi:hypothetical protein
MPRSNLTLRLAVSLLPAAILACATAAGAVEPTLFELVINGESFAVEANRVVELTSPRDPEVKYQVALRIAPTQRIRLNAVEFDYDRLCELRDDRGREQRTVRIEHELGFTMLVTDLGGTPLSEETQQEALQLLVDSVVANVRGQQVQDLEVGGPQPRRFQGASGLGVTIHYRDAQDLGRTYYVYVLSGTRFAVSCVVQYVDNDLEDVRELIGQILNSFAPVR